MWGVVFFRIPAGMLAAPKLRQVSLGAQASCATGSELRGVAAPLKQHEVR